MDLCCRLRRPAPDRAGVWDSCIRFRRSTTIPTVPGHRFPRSSGFFGAYALLNLTMFYFAMPRLKGIDEFDDRKGKIAFWTMSMAMMLMGFPSASPASCSPMSSACSHGLYGSSIVYAALDGRDVLPGDLLLYRASHHGHRSPDASAGKSTYVGIP